MNKKFLVFICLILFFLSIAGVSAMNVNQAIEDTDDMVGIADTLDVSLSNDEVIGSADNGTFTDLQKKIDDADEGSTINLENDYHSEGSGEITINKVLTINGNGHVIDALGSSGIFSIASSKVTLKNIELKHGLVEGYGAAIYSDGNIDLYGCTFIDFQSHEHGGAIYSTGDVTLVDCIFENCRNLEACGGAVYSDGDVNAYGSTFLNCFSQYYGGAIYCDNNIDVFNCSFIGNSMDFSYYEGGGAIHSSGNLTVYDSIFTSNYASEKGGAIYSDGYFCIDGCNFVGNNAVTHGAAVYVGGHGSISNCNFVANSLKDSYESNDGGAIYSDADLTIFNSNFTSNYAGDSGGAIFSTNNLSLIACNFLDCSAVIDGGAIYSKGKGNFNWCRFIGCSAEMDGGAIYSENEYINIENSFFDNNLPNDFYPSNINTSNTLISSHMNLNFNKTVIYQYDAVQIQITFDEGVTGNVSVSINGVEERFKLTDNSLYIIKPNLSVGKYDVTVKYSGDDVFSPTAKNNSFKVVDSSFKDLQYIIDNLGDNELDLTKNYTYVDYIDGNSPISIKKKLKINGNGYTLDGSTSMGIFSIASPNVILNDINFVDGLNRLGGAIYSSESFDVINCRFYNCSAWRGGAIYSEYPFNIVDSSFDKCSINRKMGDWVYGSIIWVSDNDGVLTITNSTFTNPYTIGSIFNFEIFHLGCSVSLDECTFVNCSDELYTAGDVDFINSTFVNSTGIIANGYINVLNSTFVDSSVKSEGDINVFNSSFKDDSIIYYATNLNVFDSSFKDSSIYNAVNINVSDSSFLNSDIDSMGNLGIFNSSFENTFSNWDGGVIWCEGDVNVNASTFVNSFNNDDGGVIYCNSNVYIFDSSFVNSSGWKGGVIFSKGNVTIGNSSFVNSSGWDGGVIYSEANVDADNCTFVNSSAEDGAVICIVNDSSISLINCIFNQNQGKYSSGVVILNFNSTIDNCTFINNEIVRGYGGGAIYINGKLSYAMNSHLVINLSNLKLKNNMPGDYGGAISFLDDILHIGAYCSGTWISGDVFVDIAGKSFKNTFDSYGKALFELKDLPSGTWDARILYNGDDYFNSFEINVPLTIIGSSYHLEVPDVTKDYGGSERLEVTLTEAGSPVSNAKVNINLNGVDYTRTTDSNGKASMAINLNAGTYIATVSYDDVSCEATITVNKLSSKTTLSYTKNSHDSVTLTASVDPTGAGGKVTFNVNGKDYSAIVSDAKATYTLNNLAVGSYEAKATYSGDINHKSSSSTSVKFTVEDVKIEVSAPDLTKYYNGPERFVVTINEDYKAVVGKNVTINLNGRSYIRTTDSDGQASMAINLDSGKYDATVEYDGIKAYSSVTVNPTIVAKDFTKIFRNDTQYYGEFRNSDGSLLRNTDVKFNINGVFYTRTTNDQGVAKMNINLNPGSYILTATNPTNGEMQSVTITVLTSIVENYDLTKYYKNDSQYRIRLLDSQGNPVGAGVSVEFNINGVFYTRTSDAQGYVKMNINLNPGTYVITANYNGLMASNTIKVLPIIKAEDLVMSYRDGSKFEATLLDGQGKPYANQNMTFNINGVFYTRPTDDNGIARLNINLMAGEYIITSMYENGAATSNKVTIRS